MLQELLNIIQHAIDETIPYTSPAVDLLLLSDLRASSGTANAHNTLDAYRSKQLPVHDEISQANFNMF